MQFQIEPPVLVRREIDIFSPPELIWEWVHRVDLWAEWHPYVSSSWLIDDGQIGARFKWRRKLIGVQSEITAMRPGKEFGWRGWAWGLELQQSFWMDGDFRSTRLVTEQRVDGRGASLLAPLVERYAAGWAEVWLAVLKTRIESQHERGRANKSGSV
jgi:hypothetical protein